MTQAKWINDDRLALAVNDTVEALSRGARAVLLSHPDALRVALAVVAETIEVKIDLDGVAAKLIKAPGVTIPNREFHAGFSSSIRRGSSSGFFDYMEFLDLKAITSSMTG